MSVDLDAYFGRIGYAGPREPTLEVLTALHALHPAAIPFEAIDCLLDAGVDISPAAIDAKLIHGRRGGYCFEQNSLFARALEALGFQVHQHAARVRWNLPADFIRPRTHQVLRVTLGAENYIADVGFGGCVLTAPLRLALDAPQETRHDTYRLVEIHEGCALECLRDGEWRRVWDLSFLPCVPADYEMGNWFTSAHPQSHFRRDLIVSSARPEARYAVLNNRLTVRPVGGEASHQFFDADGLEVLLAERFGLAVSPDWRAVLERAVAVGAPA